MNLTQFAEQERQRLDDFGVKDQYGNERLASTYKTIYKQVYGWEPKSAVVLDSVTHMNKALQWCDKAEIDFKEYVTAQMQTYKAKRDKMPSRLKRKMVFRSAMLVSDAAAGRFQAHRAGQDRRGSSKFAEHLKTDFKFQQLATLHEIAIGETIIGACRVGRPIDYAQAVRETPLKPEYEMPLSIFDRDRDAQSVRCLTIRAARAEAIRRAFYSVSPETPGRIQLVDPTIDWNDYIPVLGAAMAARNITRAKPVEVELEFEYKPAQYV